jgi:phosphoribosylamine-glycine ligase
MNILILGTGTIEQKLIEISCKSKLLDHIYTASNTPLETIPNIEYLSFDDLIFKIKSLQIDLVLFSNKDFIKNGLVEILKKNLINTISVNQKWLNLETSRLAAKQLMNHYSINNPEIIKAPMFFPIVIKTNEPIKTKIVYSMQELIETKKALAGSTTFLEEYCQGEVFNLLSLWDGKNILCFDKDFSFSEVQRDRLELYKTKLNFMLSDEKADFIGFFVSRLIWSKNDWHVLEFSMHINENIDLNLIDKDFLYILNSAIYQKLNEIK